MTSPSTPKYVRVTVRRIVSPGASHVLGDVVPADALGDSLEWALSVGAAVPTKAPSTGTTKAPRATTKG
jgi:hypothetical protein